MIQEGASLSYINITALPAKTYQQHTPFAIAAGENRELYSYKALSFKLAALMLPEERRAGNKLSLEMFLENSEGL